MIELFANSGDPDQKQPSVASNVDLHCVIYLSIFEGVLVSLLLTIPTESWEQIARSYKVARPHKKGSW